MLFGELWEVEIRSKFGRYSGELWAVSRGSGYGNYPNNGRSSVHTREFFGSQGPMGEVLGGLMCNIRSNFGGITDTPPLTARTMPESRPRNGLCLYFLGTFIARIRPEYWPNFAPQMCGCSVVDSADIRSITVRNWGIFRPNFDQ